MIRRLQNALLATPIWCLAIYGLISLALVVVQVKQIVEHTRYSTAREAAVSYSAALSTIRQYYSAEIVPRARSRGVTTNHDYHQREGSIPLPATLTIELGERVSRSSEGGKFRLYSAYPFPWRQSGGPHDDFEREALQAFAETADARTFVRVETRDGTDVLRFAEPVRMEQTCVDCHNSHPNSPRNDWRPGDVRGVQSVEIPMPMFGTLSNLPSYGLFASMVIAILGGFVMFGLALRRLIQVAQERQRLLESVEARNEELLETKAGLEKASRIKTDFLAIMSHELRTPLNAIIGFSDLLRRKAAAKPEAAGDDDYAIDINSAGQHLLALVNDILDYARIESGEYTLRERDVDIGKVVSGAVAALDKVVAERDLRVDVTTPERAVRLRADEAALRQMLSYVLSNATKFTPEGGSIAVSVSVDTAEAIMITVADDGIGIPAERLPQILEPFGQVEGAHKRKFGGAGLGLSLCKRLVELHQGSLGIDSAPDRGTAVTLRFPPERTSTAEVAAA